jgi:hypothetical protein
VCHGSTEFGRPVQRFGERHAQVVATVPAGPPLHPAAQPAERLDLLGHELVLGAADDVGASGAVPPRFLTVLEG